MTELPRSNYSDFINEGQKNNDRGRKYKKDMRRGGADRDGVVGQRWATGLRRGAFLCCAWLAQTGGRTVIFHPKRRQENQLGSIVAMGDGKWTGINCNLFPRWPVSSERSVAAD